MEVSSAPLDALEALVFVPGLDFGELFFTPEAPVDPEDFFFGEACLVLEGVFFSTVSDRDSSVVDSGVYVCTTAVDDSVLENTAGAVVVIFRVVSSEVGPLCEVFALEGFEAVLVLVDIGVAFVFEAEPLGDFGVDALDVGSCLDAFDSTDF